MNLAIIAYEGLFPNIKEDRELLVSYSAKFKSLNANVKYTSTKIHFYLSKDWHEYSEDLRIGLIQHLLTKIFSKREYDKTLEMDLYFKFIENLGRYAKIEHDDPILEESFNRINQKYFSGLMNKPNLKWGQDAFRKLGHYEYASDLIVISSVFRGEPRHLDYIMHHEMLHKKHGQKTSKTGRSMHHTSAFKADEAKYEDKDAEKNLTKFLRKKRFKKIFWF